MPKNNGSNADYAQGHITSLTLNSQIMIRWVQPPCFSRQTTELDIGSAQRLSCTDTNTAEIKAISKISSPTC